MKGVAAIPEKTFTARVRPIQVAESVSSSMYTLRAIMLKNEPKHEVRRAATTAKNGKVKRSDFASCMEAS
jgi:hypothetical protein